jgi:hypothetical protein
MHAFLRLASSIPLLVVAGCGVDGGGSSSAGSSDAASGSSASGDAAGDIAMISSYPRVSLRQEAPGSARSRLTLSMLITNSTGAPTTYEILVDGVSRGVVAPSAALGLQDYDEAWAIDAGRHRVVVRIDPTDGVGESDEGNNESLIVVDVPTAASPAPASGADIAYGYPPYVTFTPLPEQNRPQCWSFLVNVPMRNNGTTELHELKVGASGDLGGSTQKNGIYPVGLVATVGFGRGAEANQPFHVVLALDPENALGESEEGNNGFTLDFVTPPGPGDSNG